MSATDPPISPEDEQALNNLQESAHSWRDSIMSQIGARSATPDDMLRYQDAMKNLRDLAKEYVEKYPGNARAAGVHSQIEAWIDN